VLLVQPVTVTDCVLLASLATLLVTSYVVVRSITVKWDPTNFYIDNDSANPTFEIGRVLMVQLDEDSMRRIVIGVGEYLWNVEVDQPAIQGQSGVQSSGSS